MRALVLIALFTGCVRKDDFQCTVDEQCDIGEAGRCELDGRCTAFDDDCASNRRYTEHSGAVSLTCFDDAVVPVNPCVEGQPPALPTNRCFAAVCEAVPACCLTGWSNACVQQAQLRCPEVQCDTRIAITADNELGTTELWDVRSVDGVTWTVEPVTGSLLAWIAPAPGTPDPRLVRVDAGGLFAGDVLLHPLDPARRHNDVTSADVDRSGHDTIVIGSTASDPTTPLLEIVDLTTGITRELTFDASSRIEWGDYDHDAFPDAVVATNGPTYLGAINVLSDADRSRVFAPGARANVAGNITPQQSPAIRSLAWADLDGDHTLDLIVGGNSMRVHLAEQTSTNQPIVTDEVSLTADCDPVVTMGTGQCAQEAMSFASAVVPRDGGADVALVAFPKPEAHLLAVTRGTPNTGALTPLSASCPTCDPFIAIVARDLNHDGVIDLVAFDLRLGLWTMLSPATELTFVTQIRPMTRVRSIRVSVGGGV